MSAAMSTGMLFWENHNRVLAMNADKGQPIVQTSETVKMFICSNRPESCSPEISTLYNTWVREHPDYVIVDRQNSITPSSGIGASYHPERMVLTVFYIDKDTARRH